MNNNEYLKVSEAAQKWGISPRRVRVLCNEGRIAGKIRNGNLYMIPGDAEQPKDARTGSAQAMIILIADYLIERLQEMVNTLK